MTRSIRWIFCLFLVTLAIRAYQQPSGPSPAQLAAQADRQKMMDVLHIASLRQGANGNDPQAPNAANYDETKANPFPDLPDPLVLNNGKKVTSSKMWTITIKVEATINSQKMEISVGLDLGPGA